ncbi:UPF0489 protein C5orf22 homolog isoform X2 [Aplysia californica]|uniref:UPF0489 protein C5orf22 homolog isoform X2 n=1 Tax=Aplysia californica TaxID=6500 RepID=A0ABM1VWN3_APLCA|nr:UPF0489 protein C5orf22 homolog isoform X2 [Aplysia californica]
MKSLSIENWLLPLAYAKHVNHVIWVKPPWAQQIQSSEQNFSIGKCSQSGNVRLSCKENYFLTDGLFQTVGKLTNTTDVKLTVVELLPEKWSQFDPGYCDTTNTSGGTIPIPSQTDWIPTLLDQLMDQPYILDIDLDFFSTANPFKDMLKPEEEQALTRLYHYSSPSDSTNDGILSFTKTRQKQLEKLERVFSSLESKWSDCEKVPSLKELEAMTLTELVGMNPININWCDENVQDLRLLTHAVILEGKSRDMTFTNLHDYGCTLDDTELPHHISTPEQLEVLHDEFSLLMERLPRPAIVTIARSSDDDYCPKNQVDQCQTKVLSVLEHLYGSLDITSEYS